MKSSSGLFVLLLLTIDLLASFISPAIAQEAPGSAEACAVYVEGNAGERNDEIRLTSLADIRRLMTDHDARVNREARFECGGEVFTGFVVRLENDEQYSHRYQLYAGVERVETRRVPPYAGVVFDIRLGAWDLRKVLLCRGQLIGPVMSGGSALLECADDSRITIDERHNIPGAFSYLVDVEIQGETISIYLRPPADRTLSKHSLDYVLALIVRLLDSVGVGTWPSTDE